MKFQQYRERLRREFGYRCGYCGVADGAYMMGGIEGWGTTLVEHFRPISRFPELADDFENLVYACYRCSRARGLIWSDKAGREIVHRKMADYINHLHLNGRGILEPRSSSGEFSVYVLNLNEPIKVRLRRQELEAVNMRREMLPRIPDLLGAIARLPVEDRETSIVSGLESLVGFIRESFERYPGIEPQLSLLVQAVTYSYRDTEEGVLVHSITPVWQLVARLLKEDPSLAFEIAPHKWEELVAAAFDEAGYDHVVLTPRSGDYGRDVIATKEGVGAVRIIGSVKAYKPGHLVRHDDVRALLGVLSGDMSASKGIITTTSDFAPSIKTDPFISPFIPYRLELMNGNELLNWFDQLLGKIKLETEAWKSKLGVV